MKTIQLTVMVTAQVPDDYVVDPDDAYLSISSQRVIYNDGHGFAKIQDYETLIAEEI